MADVGSAIVAPTLGTIFCIGMWLSPLRAVLEVRRTKKLGALNPLPFGITVVNCIAWVMYSCQKRDFFIFFANGSGLVLGFFYCLSIFPYLNCDENATVEEKQMKMRVEVLVVGGVAFWAMIAMIVFIILDPTQSKDVTTGQTVVSSFAVITTLSYYASPLTTMAEVIKIKDSSSLYAPMIIMNLATAFLWYSCLPVCVRCVYMLLLPPALIIYPSCCPATILPLPLSLTDTTVALIATASLAGLSTDSSASPM
jgi:solute carrier family 50 protein (sugar transporter)